MYAFPQPLFAPKLKGIPKISQISGSRSCTLENTSDISLHRAASMKLEVSFQWETFQAPWHKMSAYQLTNFVPKPRFYTNFYIVWCRKSFSRNEKKLIMTMHLLKGLIVKRAVKMFSCVRCLHFSSFLPLCVITGCTMLFVCLFKS